MPTGGFAFDRFRDCRWRCAIEMRSPETLFPMNRALVCRGQDSLYASSSQTGAVCPNPFTSPAEPLSFFPATLTHPLLALIGGRLPSFGVGLDGELVQPALVRAICFYANGQCSHAWCFQATDGPSLFFSVAFPSLTPMPLQFTFNIV